MKSVHLRRQRVLRSAAALVAVGSLLAACGGDDDDATAPSASPSVASPGSSPDSPAAGPTDAGSEPATIQFVNPLPSFPTWRLLGDCMKEQAEARGAEFSESGPTGQADDPSAMIEQMQQAIANEVDAIITFPASEGFSEVLKQAQAAGIVTGTIYGPGGPESGADFNAGPDWAYIGESVVNAVAALPGEHVLGLVAAADTGLGKSWLDAVKAAAANTDNVTIAGEVYTADDAAKALPQVTALLTAHPDITQIVTHMGTVTPGAVAAIKSKSLQNEVFLMAVGHDNGGTEAIEEGTANLMLMQDVCGIGSGMADGVLAVLEGEPTPVVPIEVAVIGKDDVESYLSEGWV